MSTYKSYEIVTWQEVKTEITALNPLLAKQINKIGGVNKFKLLRVRYPFGEKIIDKGQFYLNIDGENISFQSAEIPKKIRSLLNYHWKAIPLGIVSHNSTESFIDHSTHVIPFRLLHPGKVFSIVSVFDFSKYTHTAPGLRSTSSGCRSLVFLPKITHAESHARLAKTYKLKQKRFPNKISDGWGFFRELSNASEKIKSDWYSEIILFGKEFLSSSETKSFQRHLLLSTWTQDSFRRNEGFFDFILTAVLKKMPRSLRSDIELLYYFKHLITVALRAVPAFVPSTNTLAAPFEDFGNIMLNCYRLRFHYPVFMQLEHYAGKEPVYYSIQHPTYFYEAPDGNRKNLFTIARMKKLKRLLVLFKEYILHAQFEYDITDTLLYQTLKYTEFDFFHAKDNALGGCSIEKLIKEDKRFLRMIKQYWKKEKLSFLYHSIFFNGLIRIRPRYKNNRIWREIIKYY